MIDSPGMRSPLRFALTGVLCSLMAALSTAIPASARESVSAKALSQVTSPVHDVFVDVKDNVWFALGDQGVLKLDGDNWWLYRPANTPFDSYSADNAPPEYPFPGFSEMLPAPDGEMLFITRPWPVSRFVYKMSYGTDASFEKLRLHTLDWDFVANMPGSDLQSHDIFLPYASMLRAGNAKAVSFRDSFQVEIEGMLLNDDNQMVPRYTGLRLLRGRDGITIWGGNASSDDSGILLHYYSWLKERIHYQESYRDKVQIKERMETRARYINVFRVPDAAEPLYEDARRRLWFESIRPDCSLGYLSAEVSEPAVPAVCFGAAQGFANRGMADLLVEDRQGRIWVGGELGLFVWDESRWRSVQLPAGQTITALGLSPSGTLLLGLKQSDAASLALLDTQTERWLAQWPLPAGVANQTPGIRKMASDGKGRIWLIYGASEPAVYSDNEGFVSKAISAPELRLKP